MTIRDSDSVAPREVNSRRDDVQENALGNSDVSERVPARALNEKWLSRNDVELIEAEVAQEIAEAVEFAEAGTWEPVEMLTRDVYTVPLPS